MAESGLSSPETSTEEVEVYQRGISDGFSHGAPSPNAKTLKLYCFSCHRLESHYNALKGKPYHYLLIGMTFGLVILFGTYRCRCCGHKRLARYNFLNLRFHIHRRKYKGKAKTIRRVSSSTSSRSSSKSTGLKERLDESERIDSADGSQRRRRRKKKRLKSVPAVDSIGRERREQRDLEVVNQLNGATENGFTIDSLMNSFETEESLKQKARIQEELEAKVPFVARKAKPRKKLRGKPKRRHAKKERLTGPTIYCFGCKQNNMHYHNMYGTSYYSFFFGVTLGLIKVIGPFRCSICSRKRLFGANLLNPKFYIRRLIERSGDGYS